MSTAPTIPKLVTPALICLLLAHGAVPARAEAQAAPATLSQVVQAAWERYPEAPVFEARDAEAAAFSRRARSLFAGATALSARYQSDSPGSGRGLREWETGLELPLWRSGERQARLAHARAMSAATDKGREAGLLEIAGQVRERVWEVKARSNELSLAEQEWETAQALERDVQRRVQAGELARADLVLAREESLRKRSAVLMADAELGHAREAYRSLTGLDALPGEPDEPLAGVEAIAPGHPALAGVRAAVDEARAAAVAARRGAGEHASVLVGARRERGDSFTDYQDSVGVALSVPLFGAAAHRAPEQAAAQRVLAQAQAERERRRRELETALNAAAYELEATGRSLELAGERNALAAESLRLARVAFSLGETDLVKLLRVQAVAFAAERSEQQLRIQYQRAVARYNQAVGVLP